MENEYLLPGNGMPGKLGRLSIREYSKYYFK
jgi:hypothetical protein